MKKIGRIYRETLIGHLKNGIEQNKNIFLFNFSYLSSLQINTLRKDLKKTGAHVFVSKNSVAKLALKSLKQDQLAGRIKGQTAFVWSDADSVDVSKVLVKFSDDLKTKTLIIHGGLLDGSLLSHDDVKTLSSLPPRQVLLSQLLGIIQAPVARLLGDLNAKSRDLLSILKQLSEKKGGS